jgi:hypothetical protein
MNFMIYFGHLNLPWRESNKMSITPILR